MMRYALILFSAISLVTACGGSSGSGAENSSPTVENELVGQWDFKSAETTDYDAYVLIIDSSGGANNYALDYQEACYEVDEYQLEQGGQAQWYLSSGNERLPVSIINNTLKLESPVGTLTGVRPEQEYDISSYHNCATGPGGNTGEGLNLSDLKGKWQLNNETHYAQVTNDGNFVSYKWKNDCYTKTDGTITKSGNNTFNFQYNQSNNLELVISKEGEGWRYNNLVQSGVAAAASFDANNLLPICFIPPVSSPSFDTIDTEINLEDISAVWNRYSFSELSSYIYINDTGMTYYSRDQNDCFIEEDPYLFFRTPDGWFDATYGGRTLDLKYAFNKINEGQLGLFTHYTDSNAKYSRVVYRSDITISQLRAGYCE